MHTSSGSAHCVWRLSVAPMLDWTDRHCRYFHRLLTQKAVLYTEMVTTGALLHGDVPRHLTFNEQEHPVALQLGGSEPDALARSAVLGVQWGYDEINLNCGCPSERVQRGAFGACLMIEPRLVADCVKAMVDAVNVPITVKHRIGIDQVESYEFVCDFVGELSRAGCQVFIVHARNAWLKGLSPKDNREVPPLRYDWVYRLQHDFPELCFVLNGGVTTRSQIHQHLMRVQGVMVGREAYHNPWMLSQWDAEFYQPSVDSPFQVHDLGRTRETVEEEMVRYMEDQQRRFGVRWPSIARHMLGLRHGLPGARRWRQVWSDHSLKEHSPATVMRIAHGLATR